MKKKVLCACAIVMGVFLASPHAVDAEEMPIGYHKGVLPITIHVD